MKTIILLIYYILIGGIYCFESILSFYILFQLAIIFFPMSGNNIFHKIYAFLNVRIEPIFAYFRKLLPPIGMFDFSALILFFGLDMIRRLIDILFLCLLNRA